MKEKNKISRRQVIGGLRASFASVVVAPGFTALGGSNPGPFESPTLVDPTTRYAKPPFNTPMQPWPGLASKMIPRPDHGETSYKGSGRFYGQELSPTILSKYSVARSRKAV